MNPNQLLLAIAVGLLLSSAGQPGPLAGMLGPVPTSIDLSVTDCWQRGVGGDVGLTVTGCLVASSVVPAANRIVILSTKTCRSGGCTVATDTLVTRTDGSFSVWKPHAADMFDKSQEYSGSFAGDSQYGPSYSSPVRRPC